MEITRAEYAGQIAQARALANRAWTLAQDDFDACLAAHYMARYAAGPRAALRWSREAVRRAGQVDPALVQSFWPSLYLNLGRAYERCGRPAAARKYYALAAALGAARDPGRDLSHP